MAHEREEFVTIQYDGEGNPAAEPAELRVKAGTRVTWRNDPGHDHPFTLDFDLRVPEPGEPRRRLESRREAGVYQASIIATPGPAASAAPQAQAGPPEERYAYEVRVGDRVADPAIIIQR
ncbi:hypothetical protein N800_10645 [Lysobacter daejeonensis GH1-9]|uniref:Uncharacterized protein n=1 Tax=Lysobacter daejeonensis GH1-9 TaxID=1385517 RepID=A0A0A0F3U0_9GAMM|nr:hypothetical protein [Lysobacter daejeonensis]KGM56067.1 hypothetical protein N800_10645 [Lysobacter daejeonensis GH1-9]